MEKGPRYRAYAELRESRLGRKHMIPEEPEEPRIEIDPIEETNVLRKENRKPPSRLPSMQEMTRRQRVWQSSALGIVEFERE
ncbi:hypothetical protein ACFXTN_026664 [Malus domestica]